MIFKPVVEHSRTWLLTLKRPCRTDNSELGKHQAEQVLGGRKKHKNITIQLTQSLFVCRISLLHFFVHCLFRLGSTICPSVLLGNSRKGQRTSNLITRSYSRFKMNHLFYFSTLIPSTCCGSPIDRMPNFIWKMNSMNTVLLFLTFNIPSIKPNLSYLCFFTLQNSTPEDHK